MRRVPMLALLALCGTAACDAASDRAENGAADSVAAADSAARSPRIFTERSAVFLLADSARLERMHAEYGEDAGTVFDDMLWYRAEAWDWIEARGIPVVAIEGRPPLRFRVAGDTMERDYAGAETADVVILYDADREPVALAPVSVPERAPLYFTDLPLPPQP